MHTLFRKSHGLFLLRRCVSNGIFSMIRLLFGPLTSLRLPHTVRPAYGALLSYFHVPYSQIPG